MRTIAWTLAGCLCSLIGLVGLILPIIPGILFLILAALCFERASRSDRQRNSKPGRGRRANLASYESAMATAMPIARRIQLQFWLLARSLLGKRSGRHTATPYRSGRRRHNAQSTHKRDRDRLRRARL